MEEHSHTRAADVLRPPPSAVCATSNTGCAFRTTSFGFREATGCDFREATGFGFLEPIDFVKLLTSNILKSTLQETAQWASNVAFEREVLGTPRFRRHDPFNTSGEIENSSSQMKHTASSWLGHFAQYHIGLLASEGLVVQRSRVAESITMVDEAAVAMRCRRTI
ncbi:hypothetical protein DPMN_192445 [Dreissena polymorpha]|uniref:Uncharacterized protein n=1 Tax=Dreissena polymorpha TaxID=45954 RepID=A0A9D3Y533_DREPO|nr:hypothetical protein DPMN_192445 [Dreissena polymorpha]